jgi:hypothetical protein
VPGFVLSGSVLTSNEKITALCLLNCKVDYFIKTDLAFPNLQENSLLQLFRIV